MNIKTLLDSGANISITITPADLKEFALTIIQESIKMGNEQKTPESYLTQKETAEKLKVSENTLWRWKRTGYLMPIKIGNSVYYRASDIEKLYKQRD